MGTGSALLISLAAKWWVGMAPRWRRFPVLWGEALLPTSLVSPKIEPGSAVSRGCSSSGTQSGGRAAWIREQCNPIRYHRTDVWKTCNILLTLKTVKFNKTFKNTCKKTQVVEPSEVV